MEQMNETADQSEMYIQMPYNRKWWFEDLIRAWKLFRNITIQDLKDHGIWKILPKKEQDRIKKYFY